MSFVRVARQRTLLIPVVVALCPFLGCSSQQGSDPGPTSPTFSVRGDDLPLGWFIENEVDVRHRIGKASARLLEECLQGRGFDVTVPTAPDFTANYLAERYGAISEDQAKQFGYSSPEAVESEGFGQPSYPQNDPQFDAAFDGGAKTAVPLTSPVDGQSLGQILRPGGCNGEVIDKLFGDFDGYVSYNALELWLQLKESETLASAKTAPSVQTSADSWSKCMAVHGYAFSRPDNAATNDWSDKAAESQAALIDVRCRYSSGYLAALVAADIAAQQDLLSQFPELRSNYERLLRAIDVEFG